LRTYELLFIVQPEVDEDGLRAVTEGVQQVITDNGGEIVRVDLMGRRRLAYPIRKRDAGFYVLVHAKMERPAILEVERHVKLSEDILRHLLVRLDEVQAAALDESVAAQAASAEQAAAAAQAAADKAASIAESAEDEDVSENSSDDVSEDEDDVVLDDEESDAEQADEV
jgi:small subunit ribosomal protein S6